MSFTAESVLLILLAYQVMPIKSYTLVHQLLGKLSV
jgi:hypothetical protein